jgi:hypothetical protein
MPAESDTDAIGVALRVGTAIESVGGSYFVGGSIASSLQGEPRSTNDIDIVVEMPLGRLRALREALGIDFEVDLDPLRDALMNGRCSNIFFLPAITKIDLFGVGPTAFDETEFARRRPVVVRASGATLLVQAPEDTVLRKLLHRDGGGVSDRQWRDVTTVLRINARTLDRNYLAQWASRLGVDDALVHAQREAGW